MNTTLNTDIKTDVKDINKDVTTESQANFSAKQFLNNLPIGVFDSGVGGLTVLRQLQEQLPDEAFLYLGDMARLPYGTKSPATIERYALLSAELLVSKGIKALVIACNTATAVALPILQKRFPEIPVIGVVEPGAETACSFTQNKHIAVLATEATIAAGGYHKAIKAIMPDATVSAKSCGLFVSLAEEGWVSGPIVESIVAKYYSDLLDSIDHVEPDCLLLGCTHFPALYDSIQNVVGEKIRIVDSAHATAQTVKNILTRYELHTTHKNTEGGLQAQFFVTDCQQRFARIAPHFLGHAISMANIELVNT